jgi:bla regulator protein BlaR1
MMTWMIYVIVVSLILCIAALNAERALRLRKAATRWVWIAVIMASLVVPTIISTVSFQVPELQPTNRPPTVISFRDTTSVPIEAITRLPEIALSPRNPRELDSQLERFWLIASGAMVLVLAGSALQLFWRKRHWARATVTGTAVYTAPGIGPAVVGLLNPRIVVPPWVVESSPECQALVMAHEQQHLSARDPQLLTTALCMLVFMPWNLPLWWAIRRLRHAMEVDCDARVLRAGHDRNRYAEALIDAGERRSSFLGTVAAMAESSSKLEERIVLLLSKPARGWKTMAILLSGVAVCLLAVATQVSPPNSAAAARAQSASAVNPAAYNGYVGYYRANDAIMVVTRLGDRLFTRLVGQGHVEYFSTGTADEFFSRAVSARITFETDARGRASALTVHQNGEHRFTRIDDAAGKQIDDALTARVRAQSPNAGSEAALRATFAAFRAGAPPDALMTASMIAATHQQWETIKHSAAEFGDIQSVEFRGVGANGWDVFHVRHEHTLVTWRIILSPEGQISGLYFHPGA